VAQITYIEHDGTQHVVEVEPGYSLMQAALDNMIEGIVAECGGACSCATCHCYIDEAWSDKLGEANPIEKEMLEFAEDTRETSRLSCQIDVTQEHDGLVVHLPESQC
jgi:ferredoxin, 2Fe-2S